MRSCGTVFGHHAGLRRRLFERDFVSFGLDIDLASFAEYTTPDIEFGGIKECQIVEIGSDQHFGNLQASAPSLSLEMLLSGMTHCLL
jgi:hypothetical protein